MPESSVPVFDFAQTLPLGFRFPARMSLLPLGDRQLALVSPVPIDDARASRIGAAGEAPGLARKRPDLRIDASLDAAAPRELSEHVEVLRIDGAPGIDEYVFFHRASRTLVVTDLVFNVLEPSGAWAHLFLWLGGCHGRLGCSRVWRLQTKDKAAARASLERVLALPFESVVMAHGEVVSDDARARLAHALSERFPGARRSYSE